MSLLSGISFRLNHSTLPFGENKCNEHLHQLDKRLTRMDLDRYNPLEQRDIETIQGLNDPDLLGLIFPESLPESLYEKSNLREKVKTYLFRGKTFATLYRKIEEDLNNLSEDTTPFEKMKHIGRATLILKEIDLFMIGEYRGHKPTFYQLISNIFARIFSRSYWTAFQQVEALEKQVITSLLDPATQAARQIEGNIVLKDRAFAELGEAIAKFDPNLAMSLLAREMVLTPLQNAKVVQAVAKEIAETDFERMLTLLDGVPNSKQTILLEVGKYLVKSNLDLAIRVVTHLAHRGDQEQLIEEIVKQAPDPVQWTPLAPQLYNSNHSLAHYFIEEVTKHKALREIKQTAQTNLESAKKMIEKNFKENSKYRSQALVAVAKLEIEKASTGDAMKLLEAMNTDQERYSLVKSLLPDHIIYAEYLAGATKFMGNNHIKDPELKMKAWIAIVNAQMEKNEEEAIKNFKFVFDAAKEITDPIKKVEGLIELAYLFIKLGLNASSNLQKVLEAFIKVVPELKDENTKEKYGVELFKIMQEIMVDSFSKIQENLKSLKTLEHKAEYLAFYRELLLREEVAKIKENPEQVLVTAQQEEDPYSKAYLFAKLIEQL